MATMKVSEITIEPDHERGDTPLYVNLPDGRRLVIFASGSFTVKLPMYEGQSAGHMEEVDITLPTTDDLATHCNQETGEFRVTAWHRH